MRLLRDKAGKVPVMIIGIVVVVLILGAGGFVFLTKSKSHGGKGKEQAKVELKQWKLEEFLVNLADKDESRYLKVNIVMEVEGELAAGGEGHGGGGEGGGGTEDIKARDAIITVLTRKTYNDLVSDDGKVVLKDEIKKALNSSIEGIKVHNIYFTSFAMQ